MRLVIEIPPEMDERRFYGLFGIEGWVIREPYADFALVKTSRCNWCGECCMGKYNLVPDYLPKKASGDCAYLEKQGEKYACKLGVLRPRGCCTADPVLLGRKDIPCSIEYKKVPIEK